MPKKRYYFVWVLLLFQCSSPLTKYEVTALQWEKEIRQFEHLDSTETYPAHSILFMGSSSIRLWETIKADMAPYPVIQRGFGGAKMSDVAWYTQRIAYPHQFRALVIFVANDITGAAEDKTVGEIERLFAHIHTTVRKKYKRTPIFFIAITPTPSRWKVWPEVREVNARLEAYCQRKANTHYIKTERAFLTSDGQPRPELFQADQLHLNGDGYKIWTQLIKEKLNSEL